MTLVFSPTQALLSAEAGARFVSCFMGRLDDVSIDSTEVLAGIIAALRPGGTQAQVLAASIRHPEHVITAARLGCEVATVPGKVLRQMLDPADDSRHRPLHGRLEPTARAWGVDGAGTRRGGRRHDRVGWPQSPVACSTRPEPTD